MGKKDITLREFFTDNRRFAKLFNTFLFNGQNVIDPDKLEDEDTTLSQSIPLKTGQENIKKTRDIIKRYGDSCELALLAVENQEAVDYGMPHRVMLYDALNYEYQRRSFQRENRVSKNLNPKEWTGGLKKTDKLIPVITLVVYYGNEAWDGPKSLREMLSIEPQSIYKHLVPDYPMHLLEVRNIDNLKAYGKELFPLFALLKYQKDSEKFRKIVYENRDIFKNIDKVTLSVLSRIIDLDKLLKLLPDKNEEKGGADMCEALRQIEQEAYERGRQEEAYEKEKEFTKRLLAIKQQEAYEKEKEIAKRLLAKKQPISFIAEVTDLSEEEIIELEKTM